VGYVHTPATQQAEAQRVKATGKQIEKQNNRPAVDMKCVSSISPTAISHTPTKPKTNYRLFSVNRHRLKNLSNISSGGQRSDFHGKFMAAVIRVSGDFLAANTDRIQYEGRDPEHRPALYEDILRAYGRFDVAAAVSVFSEVSIKEAT